MSYSITITVYSIYLYMKYSIEKVENLTKIIGAVSAASFFFMGIFCKDENGERMPFLVIIFFAVMFLYLGFSFNKKAYNEMIDGLSPRTRLIFGCTKEGKVGYFLFHLFFMILAGIMGSSAILIIISYILTGDGNAIAQGRW